MKRYKIFYILLCFLTSACTQQTPASEDVLQPSLILNCNTIENAKNVALTINIQVISADKKLFNGSLKGQGLTKDFYRDLDDVNKNSSFSGEFEYLVQNNGTYSFSIFYENSDGIYTSQCSGSVSSITTTTTSTTTTTTTTVRKTTTTTTTVPKTTTTALAPILDVVVTSSLSECKDRKQKSTITINNVNSNVGIYVELQKWEDSNWVVEYSGEIDSGVRKSFEYTVPETRNSGRGTILPSIEWAYRYKQIGTDSYLDWQYKEGVLSCEVEFDKSQFEKRNFKDRGDNPFICEIPEDDYDWVRCINSEKWRQTPSFEVAASNWVDFCMKGGYYYTDGYCGENG